MQELLWKWDEILDAVWAWEVSRGVQHEKFKGGKVLEACMEYCETVLHPPTKGVK